MIMTGNDWLLTHSRPDIAATRRCDVLQFSSPLYQLVCFDRLRMPTVHCDRQLHAPEPPALLFPFVYACL